MRGYSFASLIRNALRGHRHWPRAWRSPQPARAYDVIIVGAGGHGLATAYYLAREHGITNVAVLEKGWLGGGNTGRNTTIVRSNYLEDASAALYDHALKLWPSLSRELNYNIMYSARGVLNLAHEQNEARDIRRRVHANRLNGIDSQWLDAGQVKQVCPIIDISKHARYPIQGGSYQPSAGVARHDAVAWGYARAADALGVDIIQQCEVTGIARSNGRVTGVDTTRGSIRADKVAIVVSGHTSSLAAMAGMRLPIESHPLQALVSEPIKPVMPTVVMSNLVHVYLSQTDKGELVIGAGIDGYNSYTQRGGFNIVEEQLCALKAMFPLVSRLRMMRQWAGTVDICPDASPLICKTPLRGFYINGGWGTGGFKATPGSGHLFAHTIARDEPHPKNAAFSLERFATGALVAEHGAAAVAH
ncbi:MAG: sarcosine oxidase subunit beta family protein [Wenzhouxiangellaceae bacterium]